MKLSVSMITKGSTTPTPKKLSLFGRWRQFAENNKLASFVLMCFMTSNLLLLYDWQTKKPVYGHERAEQREKKLKKSKE